jgi:hypothetical protein
MYAGACFPATASDPGYASEEARAQAFVEMSRGGRAPYFNRARKLNRAAA